MENLVMTAFGYVIGIALAVGFLAWVAKLLLVPFCEMLELLVRFKRRHSRYPSEDLRQAQHITWL